MRPHLLAFCAMFTPTRKLAFSLGPILQVVVQQQQQQQQLELPIYSTKLIGLNRKKS